MDGYSWAPVVDRQDEMSKDLKQILEMIGQGISQTEISKRMDVSQPYISKIKKQFVQEGLIDGDSKLTEKGTNLLG
jgi:Mn-dependent DtxR family transcriptional regulator